MQQLQIHCSKPVQLAATELHASIYNSSTDFMALRRQSSKVLRPVLRQSLLLARRIRNPELHQIQQELQRMRVEKAHSPHSGHLDQYIAAVNEFGLRLRKQESLVGKLKSRRALLSYEHQRLSQAFELHFGTAITNILSITPPKSVVSERPCGNYLAQLDMSHLKWRFSNDFTNTTGAYQGQLSWRNGKPRVQRRLEKQQKRATSLIQDEQRLKAEIRRLIRGLEVVTERDEDKQTDDEELQRSEFTAVPHHVRQLLSAEMEVEADKRRARTL